MPVDDIRPDKTIDMSADAPGIPEVIKAKALRNLASCNRITIDYETKKQRWTKINGFKLTCEARQQPKEDIDDVCEMVMRCIAFHYQGLQQADDDTQGANYRVFFHRLIDDGKVARPSFEYYYDPEATSDTSSTTDFVDEDPRDKMIEFQQSLLDKIFLRMDEAHQHIIALSNQNSNALKPLTEMTDYMGRAWLAGTSMQTQALALVFDHKKAEAQVRADADMAKEYLGSLNKFGKVVATQLGKYVKKKLGDDMPEEEEETATADWDGASAQGADDDGDGKPAAQATSSSSGPSARAEPGKGRAPLADYVGAIADSLTAKQWNKIADAFTKKERSVLTTLFESETDGEAIAAYDVLEEMFEDKMEKLFALREMLNGDQQQALDSLGDVVKRARAGWK